MLIAEGDEIEDGDADKSRTGAGRAMRVSSVDAGGAAAAGAADSSAFGADGTGVMVRPSGTSGFDYSDLVRKTTSAGLAAHQKGGKKKKKKKKGTLNRKTCLFFLCFFFKLTINL